MTGPAVVAVHRSARHEFSKAAAEEVELVAGLGVAGDCHAGARVQHRSRVRRDPDQPNLRQVHLIAGELLDELAAAGHDVPPGRLGENVTTRGVDLLGLATGTTLRLGGSALVTVTGLRNPCSQIEWSSPGLLALLVGRDADGTVVRRAGVMGVVVLGGTVRAGDPVEVAPPPGPPVPLALV
ncbi:MOSC domain-containing protein [Aquipuribacter hungaricus]|uniref:MOSC domain-containing protein n=1 Tax=Aquipuribacter hungaricus TaxID=545624 RepID=A0ABV7WEM0_9MICO